MKPSTVISKTFFFEVFITAFSIFQHFCHVLSLMIRMKTSTETLDHRREILFSQPAPAFSEGFVVRMCIFWFIIYQQKHFQTFLCFFTFSNSHIGKVWHIPVIQLHFFNHVGEWQEGLIKQMLRLKQRLGTTFPLTMLVHSFWF